MKIKYRYVVGNETVTIPYTGRYREVQTIRAKMLLISVGQTALKKCAGVYIKNKIIDDVCHNLR
ncbi:hypothetical protein JPSP43_15280 [Staphylococcus pseudintermedius]